MRFFFLITNKILSRCNTELRINTNNNSIQIQLDDETIKFPQLIEYISHNFIRTAWTRRVQRTFQAMLDSNICIYLASTSVCAKLTSLVNFICSRFLFSLAFLPLAHRLLLECRYNVYCTSRTFPFFTELRQVRVTTVCCLLWNERTIWSINY